MGSVYPFSFAQICDNEILGREKINSIYHFLGHPVVFEGSEINMNLRNIFQVLTRMFTSCLHMIEFPTDLAFIRGVCSGKV